MIGSSEPIASSVSSITADRPRTKLEEDELGHRDFADAIAKALSSRAADDGFVIAVHGKWGSGKTTAVNMVVDSLERIETGLDEDKRTIVVRFNPWWFSEQNDLTRAFFTELNASIGRRLSSGVRDGLRTIAKRISGATDLVASVLAFTPAAPIAKPLADGIKAGGEGVEEERGLEEVRDDLATALTAEGRNIVIIIDDVDRLLAEEARQIFRLVKSVADLPRVTYLLVFDRDITARALERPADPDGPEWLEKIVQASFDLPPVAQIDLNRMFVHRLGAIVGNEPIKDQMRWGNIFHGAIAPWLRTPRDVGRLANAVAMAWPTVQGEVDLADFVAIETMRLFEPALYDFVRTQADKLTGAETERGERAEREAFGAKLLSYVDETKHSRVKRGLTFVFPRLDAIFANTWRGGSWQRDESEHRVSSKRRFPVYFNLGLGDGLISSAEMDEVRASYADPVATRALVQTYVDTLRRSSGTRASALLNALMLDAYDTPVPEAETRLRAILAAADLFLNAVDNQHSPQELPSIWAVSFVIDPIFNLLEPERRAAVLAEAIDGPSPKTATFMVNVMSAEHGRIEKEEAKPEEERRLSIAQIQHLEARLAARIARDATAGLLTKNEDAATLIWTWVSFDKIEPVRKWIKQNLGEAGFEVWLMRTFTSQGSSWGDGDMVSRRMYTVNREQLSTLLDVDSLETAARERIANSQDVDGAAANFIAGLHQRL